MKGLSKGGLLVKRYLKPDPARYFQQGGVQNFSNARLADAKAQFAGDYSEEDSTESLSSSGISYLLLRQVLPSITDNDCLPAHPFHQSPFGLKKTNICFLIKDQER